MGFLDFLKPKEPKSQVQETQIVQDYEINNENPADYFGEPENQTQGPETHTEEPENHNETHMLDEQKLTPQQEALIKVLKPYYDIFGYFYPYVPKKIQKDWPNIMREVVLSSGFGMGTLSDRKDGIYLIPISLCVRNKMKVEDDSYILIGIFDDRDRVNQSISWLVNECGAQVLKNDKKGVEFCRININKKDYDFYFDANLLKKPSILRENKYAMILSYSVAYADYLRRK
jgi:hypothetical protein